MVPNHTLFKTEKEQCLQWYVEKWSATTNWPAVPKLAQVQINISILQDCETGQRHCFTLTTT